MCESVFLSSWAVAFAIIMLWSEIEDWQRGEVIAQKPFPTDPF
jgi:hypothetical protein